ncbi:MAG: hypothetical protein HY647_04275 [Acidobacteria bacterium]|nr:hypothetical protein [Acidobacteriota bacterium]
MRAGYTSRGLQWLPMTALAALLASGVLGLVFPEPFDSFRVPERLAAFGLCLLLVWLWLMKSSSGVGNQRLAWMGWVGLLGLTLLVGPGILWAIWAEDPEASAPPAWLNWLTLCGYPLVLVWAYQRLRAILGAVRKTRAQGF